MEEKKHVTTRRRILKIGASLFAFIPAALYLKDAPSAFAYEICGPDDPRSTSCGDWYCIDNCGLYEWARLCTSYGTRSNEQCASWVEWGGDC